MRPLLYCAYLLLSHKILRPLQGRENIYPPPFARYDEIWYNTLILNGGIGQRVGKVATATAREKGVKKMNIIIEATKADGTRQLIAPSKIREYARIAKETSPRRKMHTFGKMLANFMFCYGFITLVEIAYNCDTQTRTLIMAKA